jgi:hypothetical protein
MTREEIVATAAHMGHTLPDVEVDRILDAIQGGERFGYGNLICWLSTAWALQHVRQSGLPWEQASGMVHGTPYPVPREVIAKHQGKV